MPWTSKNITRCGYYCARPVWTGAVCGSVEIWTAGWVQPPWYLCSIWYHIILFQAWVEAHNMNLWCKANLLTTSYLLLTLFAVGTLLLLGQNCTYHTYTRYGTTYCYCGMDYVAIIIAHVRIVTIITIITERAPAACVDPDLIEYCHSLHFTNTRTNWRHQEDHAATHSSQPYTWSSTTFNFR